MSFGIFSANIIGNLVRDPSDKSNPTLDICEFTVAINKHGRNKEENVIYVDCVCYGSPVSFLLNALKKGNRIFVSGDINENSWIGQDGQKRKKFTLIVSKFCLLSDINSGRSNRSSSDEYEDVSDSGSGEEKEKEKEEEVCPF